MRLDFGAATGGIAQVAYVVADIEAAMTQYTRHLDVGRWFVRGPFTPPEGLLRGRPHSPTFTLARGFTGHTMVELIAQHDDGPSVYHEGPGPRHYGSTCSVTGTRAMTCSTSIWMSWPCSATRSRHYRASLH